MAAPVLMISMLVNTLLPTQASAFSNKDVEKALKAGWVAECTSGAIKAYKQNRLITDSNIFSGTKNGDELIIGHVVRPDSGKLPCNQSNIKNTLSELGYSDMSDFMKNMGCSMGKEKFSCSRDFTRIELYNEIAKQKKLVSINDPVKYDISFRTLIDGCSAKPIKKEEFTKSSNKHVMVTEYKDGKMQEVAYEISGRDRVISTINTSTNGASGSWNSDGKFTCQGLAAMTKKYSSAYELAVDNGTVATPVNSDEMSGGSDGGEGDGEDSSCAISTIGWIVCPVVNFLSEAADAAYGFLADHFLEVPASLFSKTEDSGKRLYDTWAAFLGFANAALVLVFLAVIYSHITGAGISNLNLKRMVPRLVTIAILVNLSYYICAIAIDLSNILGYALKEMFESVGVATSSGTEESYWSTGFDNTWVQLGQTVMVGAAAAVGIGMVAFIGVVAIAVISLLMIFFILTLRQALIVLLVIIAPLAFVAYVLPNTEQWFKRWSKMFTSVLLVFPIVGLIFGASSLAASVMSSTVGDDIIGQISAAAVMVLPLFMVPSVLKKSLNSVGDIGGKIAGVSGRMSSGAKSKIGGSNFAKYSQEKKSLDKAKISAGTYDGRNPISRSRSVASRRFNNSKASGRYGDQRALMGAKIEAARDKENMDGAQQWLSDQGFEKSEDIMKVAVDSGNNYSSHQRRAAIGYLSGRMSTTEVEKLAEHAGNIKGVEHQKEREAIASAVASNKTMAPYMATGSMMAAMEQGESINVEKKKVEWAKNNSSGEALSSIHPNALKEVVKSSRGDAEAVLALSRAKADLMASPSASKITGGLQEQLDKIPDLDPDPAPDPPPDPPPDYSI